MPDRIRRTISSASASDLVCMNLYMPSYAMFSWRKSAWAFLSASGCDNGYTHTRCFLRLGQQLGRWPSQRIFRVRHCSQAMATAVRLVASVCGVACKDDGPLSSAGSKGRSFRFIPAVSLCRLCLPQCWLPTFYFIINSFAIEGAKRPTLFCNSMTIFLCHGR